MNRRSLVLAAALLLGATLAHAQAKKVYRCEIAGKVTYADAPCKDGTEIQADDSRSEAQRKAAQDAVKREEKMADKMRRERLADEQRASRQGAARIPYSAAERASAPAAGKEKKPVKPARKPPPAAPPG